MILCTCVYVQQVSLAAHASLTSLHAKYPVLVIKIYGVNYALFFFFSFFLQYSRAVQYTTTVYFFFFFSFQSILACNPYLA